MLSPSTFGQRCACTGGSVEIYSGGLLVGIFGLCKELTIASTGL